MFVSGDITAIGSQIKTGLDVALNAADDINLISSQNTQWLEGENSSSGGAIGIGIGIIAGAQGGKNAVENNNLASVLAAAEANKPGTAKKWQEQQQAAIREACSGGTPVSCEMAVAGVGTLLSGGILPEAMVIAGVVSAGAISGIDLAANGSVDPKNVIGAYWAGALTRYTGFKTTVLINAATGATTSAIDEKNPFLYGTISGMGSAIGYGIGNKFIAPVLDDAINPTWKTLQWNDIGMGISQPFRLNPIPGTAGTFSGGVAGEGFNVLVDPHNNMGNEEKSGGESK